jgi:hypothetical protein
MSIRSVLKALVLSLALAMAHGCAADRPAPRSPRYSIAFHNGTAFQLFDVQAVFAAAGQTYKLTAGPLAPGTTKAQHEERDPIPESATVSWESASGQKQSQQVAITSAIADLENFKGTIYFKFTYDGVKLIPLTDANRRRLVERRQSYP